MVAETETHIRTVVETNVQSVSLDIVRYLCFCPCAPFHICTCAHVPTYSLPAKTCYCVSAEKPLGQPGCGVCSLAPRGYGEVGSIPQPGGAPD